MNKRIHNFFKYSKYFFGVTHDYIWITDGFRFSSHVYFDLIID